MSSELKTLDPVAWVREHARPLAGAASDWDPLIELIGDARVVMLGEASHGTSQFYATRAHITQRLIRECGFNFVAVEGDWPDAYRVNNYVRGGPGSALDSLAGFKRFPTWMWRNHPVLDFVGWLRRHNDGIAPDANRVGFYGLDVYSLHASMVQVIRYLQQVEPAAAKRAASHFACLEPFRDDTQRYALEAHTLATSCEDEVVAVLQALLARREGYEIASSPEAFFAAEINALAAVNAERYYRRMVQGGAVTWNLRDRHMMEVLNRLLERRGPQSKAVVWEHNSHIGDFRATYEGRGAYLNLGQLVREHYGASAVAVGYGTHHGTVTAADAWDGPATYKPVPPAREGSYESIFHAAGIPRFYLELSGLKPERPEERWLFETRNERAIGVVYDPHREAFSNYVPTQLAKRYDAYLFFDETLAVEPLDTTPGRLGLETYPEGL